MYLSINPKRLFWTLMSIVGILTVLSFIGILRYWDHRFTGIADTFDLGAELTVSSWYASLLHLIATLLCALITWDHTQRRVPTTRQWGYLTIVFLLMSVDEVASLHDRLLPGIGNMMSNNRDGLFFYAWVIPGIIIVIIFGLLYLPFFLKIPRKIGISLILGLSIFVIGAVGFEMLGGWVTSIDAESYVMIMTLSLIEELLEMLGICIVIWGLAHYLRDYGTVRISVGMSGQKRTDDVSGSSYPTHQ